jgi:hypothetical protein
MKKLTKAKISRSRRKKLPVTPLPEASRSNISELDPIDFDWLPSYCVYCDGPIESDETVCWNREVPNDLFHIECAELLYKDEHDGQAKKSLMIPGFQYERLNTMRVQ